MKKIVLFCLFISLLALVPMANAVTPVQDPHTSGELNLYQVVNEMMGTSFTSSSQLGPYEIECEVQCDGWWHEYDGFIAITATYAGYNQDLYWENSTDSGFILSASTDGIDPNADTYFYTTGGDFYFKDVTTGGTWYSVDSMNSDLLHHMVTYGFGNDIYICGFEDLSGLGDQDYNDFVFKITFGAVPTCVPTVSDIPNQTVWAGDPFATISLDNYVEDCDHSDSEISWTTSGQSDLTVSIDSNRVATITYPPGWTGSETITFTATDPDGHSDSDVVIFTVQPIAAPIVSDIPNQVIVVGDSFATINLDDYVEDPDNEDWEISWGTSGETNITVTIDVNRVAHITYPPGWMGSEIITFTATDPYNHSGSDSATFAVVCGTTCAPCRSVGGIGIPIDKVVLLAPWIILGTVLAATIIFPVVMYKKKRSNSPGL